MYAPIILFAFNRLEPLKACVASLLNNKEAAESDLIVFVDGPRATMEGEAKKVEAVKQFVSGITGFKSLETHFSETNRGLGPSIIAGVTDIITHYGKAIVIEDDLVASRNLLAFVNQGLDKYENNPEVFSICAYSNRVKAPKEYKYDAYFAPRSSSWGWASWKDRWMSCDWELKDWASVEKNARAFNRWGGSDCFGMLKGWKEGRNKSWAIRFCYCQFVQDKVSLFPLVSKIDNEGFDGSGTNCQMFNRFRFDFDETEKKEFILPDTFEINPILGKEALKYHTICIRIYSKLMNMYYSKFKKQVTKYTRPRVLCIGSLPPPVHGSAVVSLQIKNSAVINKAFRCDWVNLSTCRKMTEAGQFSVAKVWRVTSSFMKEFWLLLTRRYEVCYLAITCHGVGFLKDAPFVLLARLFCKRRVIHQHNKGMSKDVDRWPYRWLLPLCYKDAKVILLSWHLYPDIEKVVQRENVLICPNGIKVQEFKGSTSKDTNITNKVPRLLFLSNLIESKGVIVLLDALKILADKGYSFQCEFVGGETKEIDAKRFAEEVDKRQLNRLVAYRGRKYGDEKEEAFERSDIFVFPTYYANETFGLVNLEAMAHKLPIVSTNEGGIPDVVKEGENGLIAESRDAKSLAECIKKLINDPELRNKMGEDGYQKLHKYFTEEVFEHTMRDILINTVLGCRFA